MDTQPTTDRQAAADRVRAYLDAYARAGRHPEHICGVWVDDSSESFNLLVSDLRTLIDQP
jgi:hypothetical protein